jgi:hypothetical protein
LLAITAGRIAREFWWTTQAFSSVNVIIVSWFSMLIYHVGIDNRAVAAHSSEA